MIVDNKKREMENGITFDQVKTMVEEYLRDSSRDDPYEVVNDYLKKIPVPDRLSKVKELMILIKEAMITKAQTTEDLCRSGSPGVIVLGTHYAYPLQLSLLGYWVYDNLDTAGNLTVEGKSALHDRLRKDIDSFDVFGEDKNRYDYLLDRLIQATEKPVKEKSRETQGFFSRLLQKIK